MTEAGTSLAGFVARLNRVVERVSQADPAGADHAFRLTVSFSLYSQFDYLRCQERPFDREAFSARVEAIEQMLLHYQGVTGTGSSASRGARPVEEFVAELYSRCWANYDDNAFLETIALFEERFQLNRIGLEFIKGADCLDAGCGSGRYTFAMAKLGAKCSTGMDISERAIREATERGARLGFADAVTFLQGSVIDMPKAWTETFDFVCSNGVVHHTTNATAGLQEIFRVLKPGGRAYIFVYGSGGLFWALVDAIRTLVAPVPLEFAALWLQSLGLSPGKIFNCLDHWYTPMQERLSREEFESRLKRCGFEGLGYMPRAKVYDASERRHRFAEEHDLVGEGDLRYMVERPTGRPSGRAVQATGRDSTTVR